MSRLAGAWRWSREKFLRYVRRRAGSYAGRAQIRPKDRPATRAEAILIRDHSKPMWQMERPCPGDGPVSPCSSAGTAQTPLAGMPLRSTGRGAVSSFHDDSALFTAPDGVRWTYLP